MRDGAYYMKLVRDLPGVGSFNKAGLLLGITGASVSIIRNGGGISEETAIKIGKALDIDPGIVYADINEARAKDSVTRKFWHDISKHLGTAASVALISTLLTLPSSADASVIEKPSKTVKLNIYIMLNYETGSRSENSYIQKHSNNHPLSLFKQTRHSFKQQG